MPEYLRAYIVIFVLSSVSFFFAKKLSADLISSTQFKKWRNSWLILTSMAFLSFNYWIFCSLAFFYVSVKRLRENYPVAFYVLILFAVPPISQEIPGFGLMNYFINVDYMILISVAILLPIAIQLISSNKTLKFGAVKTDLFVLIFVLVNIGLQFRDTTLTDAVRQSVMIIIEKFLPYYVISRSLNSMDDIKKLLVAFVIASVPAAFVGMFESVRHWLLYSSVQTALGVHWSYGGYLGRDGGLRAIASLGHPIVFGYFMTVALGIYLYLMRHIKSNLYRKLGLYIILAGLIAPLSRGPWVGAAAMFSVYLLLGKNGIANAVKFGVACLFAFAIATQLPGGQKLINLIPFVGKTEQGNIEYRERLIEVSKLVIAKYPFFGNVQFRQEPEMQQLIQGQGIIDIVNTYVAVALSSGYVGLCSFVGIFISCLMLTYSSAKKIKTTNDDAFQLGRTLIATIIGVMTIITTVGSVLAVSYFYYTLIAISVAYVRLVRSKMI